MANRWLFAGSDHSCVRTLAGTPGTSTTNGTDSGWCNTSIIVGAGIKVACDFTDSTTASDVAVTGETLWVHRIFHKQNNATSAINETEINDDSDQPWLAIRWKTGSTWGLFYNSGTGGSPTWTQFGSDFTLGNGTNITIDMAITLGSPHSVSLYLDTGAGSALNQTATFTQASFTAAGMVAFTGSNGSNYAGSVLCSVGIPTITAHCCNRYPNAAGATNTFTSGTYADIDENGINDADLMASNTAGQKTTFGYSDIPTLPAGYTVGDTFLWTRAKNDGAAPTNLKPVRRDSGGSDNVGSNFPGMGLTFAPFLSRYIITKAEFDASQFGFESAA